jgi:hypothetical protein
MTWKAAFIRWQSLPRLRVSLVKQLSAARGSSVAIRHEFKLHYDSRRPQLHAFVEGIDDKTFYTSFVVRRLRGGIEYFSYDCKGKVGVLTALRELRQEYPAAEVLLFFIDKDVDNLLGVAVPDDPNLFCTDVYSIENYVSVGSAVGLLLSEVIRAESSVLDGAAVGKLFDRGISKLSRLLLPLMAWICAHRMVGGRPNLGNIRLEDVLAVDDDATVVWRRTGNRVAYFDRVCGVTTNAAVLAKARQVGRDLRRCNAPSWLRGKFAVWYVLQFARRIQEDFARQVAWSGGRGPKSLPLHSGNIVSHLVTKVREPQLLTTFLDSRVPIGYQ